MMLCALQHNMRDGAVGQIEPPIGPETEPIGPADPRVLDHRGQFAIRAHLQHRGVRDVGQEQIAGIIGGYSVVERLCADRDNLPPQRRIVQGLVLQGSALPASLCDGSFSRRDMSPPGKVGKRIGDTGFDRAEVDAEFARGF